MSAGRITTLSITTLSITTAVMGLVASTAGAGAALAAEASPPSSRAASPAPSTCAVGSACLFDGTDYRGDRIGFSNSVSDLSKVAVGSTGAWNADDMATSVYNNGRHQTVRLWQHAHFQGPSIDVPRGAGDRHLGDATGTVTKVFNNRISSGKFVAK